MAPPSESHAVVVDTSVLVAMLSGEPDAMDIVRTIAADRVRLVSPFTVLEAGTVIEARNGEPAEHAAVARAAWRSYGRGRHPAGLNIGDCVAYAPAPVTGEPLLFKGRGFTETDTAVDYRTSY